MGSGTGRGLAAGVPAKLIDFFHILFAESGVPIALCEERELTGVEKEYLV